MRVDMLLLWLAACGGDKDTGSGGADALPLTDANNYSYTGDIDVPSHPTASGADISICWDLATLDLQCHDLDPLADIDYVGLVRFTNLTQTEVETKLSQNDLQQAEASGYVEFRTENATTCANLSDFSFFGTPIDVAAEYTEGGGTYMALLGEGAVPGQGARVLSFLEPRADTTTTDVALEGGCDAIDFSADFTSLEPIVMPAEGPWAVRWDGLTRDGLGADLDPTQVDGVMLAFYEGQTPEALAAQMFDLEIIATELYTLEVQEGTWADLADASGESGNFAGFDGEGTWLLALRCGDCYNPAPLFLTVVTVEGA